MAADQIGEIEETGRHAQRRARRRRLGRLLLREKVVRSLSGFRHKPDRVGAETLRRRGARGLTKALKIDLAFQANDLQVRPPPLMRKGRAAADPDAQACPRAKQNQ